MVSLHGFCCSIFKSLGQYLLHNHNCCIINNNNNHTVSTTVILHLFLTMSPPPPCVCMCRYAHLGVCGSQKCWTPLEQELQVAMSHPKQVLGTELRSSGIVVCVLNHQAGSLAPPGFGCCLFCSDPESQYTALDGLKLTK